MEPEDIFTSALLAIGPPPRATGGGLRNSRELTDHCTEYNAFVSAAIGRKSVTTALSYAVFAIWYGNRRNYRELVRQWEKNHDLMLGCLSKRSGR